jgi:hypothetical protein
MNQWINRSHPQTLFVATFLCYFEAIMALLPLLGLRIGGLVANDPVVYLFIMLGLGLGGLGIANEKKWAYWLALAAAATHLVMFFVMFDVYKWIGTELIVSFIWGAALVGLLVHAMSREYVKVWFR